MLTCELLNQSRRGYPVECLAPLRLPPRSEQQSNSLHRRRSFATVWCRALDSDPNLCDNFQSWRSENMAIQMLMQR